MGSHAGSASPDEDINLSATDLREINRLLRLLQTRAGTDRCQLVENAKVVLEERQRRATYLCKSIFGEPAWEMLLHLYTADGTTLSLGTLVKLTGEPKSTVLRWSNYLQDKSLIGKRPDPKDRRILWVDLAERGRDLLDAYFSSFLTEKDAE
jgi:DNA-binding MarR family transcriptional regulator